MLLNYFFVSLRNMARNKGYTFINVVGLTIGMTVALLTGLWVYDELSFNSSHANCDRIVQVYKGQMENGRTKNYGQKWLPYPLLETLKDSYSHSFKRIAVADPPYQYVLAAGTHITSQTGQFIEPVGPAMFSLQMLSGSIDGLNDPYGILLAESAATALFGNEDPLGKLVRFHNAADVKVTGVYADLPASSSFTPIKFFLSWQQYQIQNPELSQQGWDNHFIFIYAELDEQVTLEQASLAVADAELNALKGIESMKEEYADSPRTLLVPMRDWHLRTTFDEGEVSAGPLRFVSLVGVIGGFVLLLACVNFMNLSTARSAKRAKEVGIRKSIGSHRLQIVMQFFSESLFIVSLSFVIAIILAAASISWFNDVADKFLQIPFSNVTFWGVCIGFVCITAMVAGSYPAIYLSSFKPARTLKGIIHTGGGVLRLREVLVVMQFTISVCLVIVTMVVYEQIMFARSLPVGYERSGLVLIPNRSAALRDKQELIRSELLRSGVVEEVAVSGGALTDIWSNGGGFTWNGEELKSEVGFGTLTVSPEYGDVVHWKLIDGGNFSGTPSDSTAIVINESAAKLFAGKNPVGEQIHWKSKWHFTDGYFRVIGVVEDMIMRSPYGPTKPTIFYLDKESRYINVRLKANVPAPEAIKALETPYRKIAPDVPFEYQFADEAFDRKFANEDRIARLSSVFAVMAIIISCLGLIGLAAFTAEQRTREIGIRKVVGASALNLWTLLSKNFVLLVAISCIAAAAIAWWGLHQWLQTFTYRVDLSVLTFLEASIGALVLAVGTVSYWILRAARRNPVEALKEG
jgi:putative ABC transport system permease protein